MRDRTCSREQWSLAMTRSTRRSSGASTQIHLSQSFGKSGLSRAVADSKIARSAKGVAPAGLSTAEETAPGTVSPTDFRHRAKSVASAGKTMLSTVLSLPESLKMASASFRLSKLPSILRNDSPRAASISGNRNGLSVVPEAKCSDSDFNGTP